MRSLHKSVAKEISTIFTRRPSHVKVSLCIIGFISMMGTGCSNDNTHIGQWVEDTKGCKVWSGSMMKVTKTTWTGECVDGYTSGKGTVVMEWQAPKPKKGNKSPAPNQTVTCMGDVHQGKLNGYAECHWSNGDSYKGTYKNTHRMTGIYTFKNGSTSKVKWVEEKNGCLVWNPNPLPNEKITWEGDCINGYAEGEGTLGFITNNLEQAYLGTLIKGKKNGEGTYKWLKHDKPCDEKKGNIYYCYKSFVGKFINNQFDKGTYTLLSGKKRQRNSVSDDFNSQMSQHLEMQLKLMEVDMLNDASDQATDIILGR